MRRLIMAFAIVSATSAWSHDIYSGVHGKNGQLCCNGTQFQGDCAATIYRERGDHFEFKTREGAWVSIPQDRITFLPVHGDEPSDDSHRSHLCYRALQPMDRTNNPENVFGDIYFYCAFIDPMGF